MRAGVRSAFPEPCASRPYQRAVFQKWRLVLRQVAENSISVYTISSTVAKFKTKEYRSVKTIGLIGGMSWESTQAYYRVLNETVRERLGGLHSARCILYSVDFAEIEAMQQRGCWEEAAALLAAAGQALERAGAGCIVLCTNTMHKVADQVEAAVSIPLLHIADAAAGPICARGMRVAGLLGTRFTMEEDFYRGRLAVRYGLRVLTPPPDERALVHRVIYEELCLGQVRGESLEAYRRIIAGLVEQGAQAIILGCTEIGLLVRQEDSPVPLFDTTLLHARMAVDWASETAGQPQLHTEGRT
jgi:aspartate racemase